MRFTVFLLMFAVFLVAFECAANAEQAKTQKGTDDGREENKLLNPTEARQSSEVPQPEHLLSELSADAVATTTTTVQNTQQSSLPQSSEKQEQLQQLQQQEQQLQTGTSQGTKDSQSEPGGTIQNGDHTAPIVRSEEEARTGQDVSPERSEAGDKSQPKPNEPSQPIEGQPPLSSQSAQGSVKDTQQKLPTTINTSDNTHARKTSPVPPNTEGTHNKPDNTQVQPPIITDVIPPLNDTTKTPNTTGASTVPQSSKQTPQSHTKDNHVNPPAPPLGTTGHTGVNPSDKDQSHSTPTPPTSSASNGLSLNTTPQNKKVTTPPSQPVIQENPKEAPSGSVQSQTQAQTQASDNTKKTVNGTTTSATPSDKNPIIPNKPATTATTAPNNAALLTDTTDRDKETHTEHTSVSSTSEPVKRESTPHANTSQQLFKALHSLDNKDSSIGDSLVCALAALATLVFVAVAPPS